MNSIEDGFAFAKKLELFTGHKIKIYIYIKNLDIRNSNG